MGLRNQLGALPSMSLPYPRAWEAASSLGDSSVSGITSGRIVFRSATPLGGGETGKSPRPGRRCSERYPISTDVVAHGGECQRL